MGDLSSRRTNNSPARRARPQSRGACHGRVPRVLSALVMCLAAGGCGHGEKPRIACATRGKPQGQAAVFLALPIKNASVARGTLDDAVRIMCRRARAAGISGLGG